MGWDWGELVEIKMIVNRINIVIFCLIINTAVYTLHGYQVLGYFLQLLEKAGHVGLVENPPHLVPTHYIVPADSLFVLISFLHEYAFKHSTWFMVGHDSS